MKRLLITYVLSIVVVFAFAETDNDNPGLKEEARQWMRAQSVKFLENKGQMTDMKGDPVPFVLFKVESPGVDVFITEKGLTYLFLKAEKEEKSSGYTQKEDDGISLSEPTPDKNIKTEYSRMVILLLF